MKTRIITGAVALAVFIAVLLAPPIVFTIALAAVIFMMLFECYTATKADTAMKVVGFISAALTLAVPMVFSLFVDDAALRLMISYVYVFAMVIVSIMLYMALAVFEHGKRDYKDILSSGFMTLYIVISMGCVWLAKSVYGTPYMLLIFICAWSCDTFAYFSGRFLGRHKLIPNVSPKKTVEGSIGGVIGAAIACLIYTFIVNMYFPYSGAWNLIFTANPTGIISYVIVAIYGLVCGTLSQIGDLTASAIKRDSGIKDFGWIFPGHGGFMDRFDSVLYIAPIIHFIMLISFTTGAGTFID